jgi:hypothetical protein
MLYADFDNIEEGEDCAFETDTLRIASSVKMYLFIMMELSANIFIQD